MGRLFMFLLVILLAVSGGIVIWHWDAFAGDDSGNEAVISDNLSVKMTVEPDGNNLNIVQKISGFEIGKAYEAVYPKEINNVYWRDHL